MSTNHPLDGSMKRNGGTTPSIGSFPGRGNGFNMKQPHPNESGQNISEPRGSMMQVPRHGHPQSSNSTDSDTPNSQPIQFGTVGQPQTQMPVRTSSAPPAEHPDQQQRTPIYQPYKGGGYQVGQSHHGSFVPPYAHQVPVQQQSYQQMPNPNMHPSQSHYQGGRGGRGSSQHRMRGGMRGNVQFVPRGPQGMQAQQYYQVQSMGGYMGHMGGNHPGMHPAYIPQGAMQYNVHHHSVNPAHHQQRPRPQARQRVILQIIDPKTNKPIEVSRRAEEKAKKDAAMNSSASAPVEGNSNSPTSENTEGSIPAPVENTSTLKATSSEFSPTLEPCSPPLPPEENVADGIDKMSVSNDEVANVLKEEAPEVSEKIESEWKASSNTSENSPNVVFGTVGQTDLDEDLKNPLANTTIVEKLGSAKIPSTIKPDKDLVPKKSSGAFDTLQDSDDEESEEDEKSDEWESNDKADLAEPMKIQTCDASSGNDSLNTLNSTEKLIYTMEYLLSFQDAFTDLPESALEEDSGWKTMEIVVDGPSRGLSRGSGRSGQGSGWTRGVQQPQPITRQSSGRSGGGNTQGGGQWQRSQEIPRRQSNRKGGRGGGRGGPVLEGPVKPLDRTENRWIPAKSTTNLEKSKKQVQGILNKMTREKFERLAGQLSSLKMESLEMLRSVINLIFDKAIGEPHFCDMYADLCVILQSSWKVWSFLKFVAHDETKKYYWTALGEHESEVVGPFDQIGDALVSVDSTKFTPRPAPPNLSIVDLRIRSDQLVKIWSLEGGKIYWSAEDLSDLTEDCQVHGPFDSADEAMLQASKQTSFKRILLNSCQEEFERDNIYDTLNEKIEVAKANENTAETVELEEQKGNIKRRMLGNIRFIGELFKKGMLQERIMHECIMKLMGLVHSGDSTLSLKDPHGAPDEENIESLCKLMTTIGKSLDKDGTFKILFNQYFQFLKKMSSDTRLCSRIRFMVKDVMELRLNNWEPRRKELKQKTLDEIRQDAEREQRRQTRGPPVRLDTRGSTRSMGGDQRRQSQGNLPSRFNQPTLQSRQSIPSLSHHDRDGKSRLGPMSGFSSMRNQDSKTSLKPRGMGFGSRRSERSNGSSNANDRRSPARDGGRDRASSGNPSNRRSSPMTKRRESSPSVSVQQLKSFAKSIITEYVSIKDLDEAISCFKEKLKDTRDGASVMAGEILQMSLEAKDHDREAMVNLLCGLYEKGFVSTEAVKQGLSPQLIASPDLKCDAPKIHEYMGIWMSRLMLVKSDITFDWLVTGKYDNIQEDEWLELVESGMLSMIAAVTLKEIKAKDIERAKKEVRGTDMNLECLLFPHQQTYTEYYNWVKQHHLDDIIPLEAAVEIVTQLDKKVDADSIIEWIEKHVSKEKREDSFFTKYAILFILELSAGNLPSSVQCNLMRGLCFKIDGQRACLIGIEQRFQKDEVVKLFECFNQEHVVSPEAFLKWRDSNSPTPKLHKELISELNSFLNRIK